MTVKYIIGIDEVGRGPLLGPVAVGIMVIENEEYQTLLAEAIFQPGKDSKKLTPRKRSEYFAKINELKEKEVLNYGVFFESNTVIDKFGIVGAIKMAIRKGLENLLDRQLRKGSPSESERVGRTPLPDAKMENYLVLLDGGLKAPAEYVNQKSIVKGDESELIISLASIAAKVTRDAKMEKLAETITRYDLKNNKGYGTAKHIADLRQYGPCDWHRQSFIRRILT